MQKVVDEAREAARAQQAAQAFDEQSARLRAAAAKSSQVAGTTKPSEGRFSTSCQYRWQ